MGCAGVKKIGDPEGGAGPPVRRAWGNREDRVRSLSSGLRLVVVGDGAGCAAGHAHRAGQLATRDGLDLGDTLEWEVDFFVGAAYRLGVGSLGVAIGLALMDIDMGP